MFFLQRAQCLGMVFAPPQKPHISQVRGTALIFRPLNFFDAFQRFIQNTMEPEENQALKRQQRAEANLAKIEERRARQEALAAQLSDPDADIDDRLLPKIATELTEPPRSMRESKDKQQRKPVRQSPPEMRASFTRQIPQRRKQIEESVYVQAFNEGAEQGVRAGVVSGVLTTVAFGLAAYGLYRGYAWFTAPTGSSARAAACCPLPQGPPQ